MRIFSVAKYEMIGFDAHLVYPGLVTGKQEIETPKAERDKTDYREIAKDDIENDYLDYAVEIDEIMALPVRHAGKVEDQKETDTKSTGEECSVTKTNGADEHEIDEILDFGDGDKSTGEAPISRASSNDHADTEQMAVSPDPGQEMISQAYVPMDYSDSDDIALVTHGVEQV